MREASYRFRATFRRRWAGYLALVVLIGLVGGVAMAAVAGARRTQSSFPAYLASTNPSDMQMFTEFSPITGTGYSEKVAAAAARVPDVKRAVTVVGFDGNLQVLGKRSSGVPGEAPPALEGSTGSDAEYFATDRVKVLQGRMADPARLDEVVRVPPQNSGFTSGPPCAWPSSPTRRRTRRTSPATQRRSPI
ncbi:MAG TPA: hypothetical protein VIJ56_08465 [Acidimicrobiales bacterium]